MPDLFSIDQEFGGSFSADGARVTFSGSTDISGAGLLSQTLTVAYNQPIQRIYELGTNRSYYVRGRSSGTVTLQRILGPRPIQTAFYETYGNVCNADNNILNFDLAAGCNTGENLASFSFGVKYAVITNFTIAVNAQDVIVNETLNLIYISLEPNTVNLPPNTTLTTV